MNDSDKKAITWALQRLLPCYQDSIKALQHGVALVIAYHNALQYIGLLRVALNNGITAYVDGKQVDYAYLEEAERNIRSGEV